MWYFKNLWLHYGLTIRELSVTPFSGDVSLSNANLSVLLLNREDRCNQCATSAKTSYPETCGTRRVFSSSRYDNGLSYNFCIKNISTHSRRKNSVEVQKRVNRFLILVSTNWLIQESWHTRQGKKKKQNTCRSFCDVRCDTCLWIIHGWTGNLQSFNRRELIKSRPVESVRFTTLTNVVNVSPIYWFKCLKLLGKPWGSSFMYFFIISFICFV